ncbi:MAG: phosphoglycerate kinase [Thermodesulfobacterium sp.]|nr:phosphoglycerate kinase [Thermodesulfobacterium sp.]
MKSIKEIDLKGKKVFIRVDFNVPIERGQILDDTRILKTIPTLEYALKAGAKVILCSHLGRPKGKRIPELSLKPVYEYLKKVLKVSVKFLEELEGEKAEKELENLREGEILLLENIRFYEGETKNDPELVKKLAPFAEVFINEAFPVSHRAHASVVGLAEIIKEKGVGFQTQKELNYLSKVVDTPEKPLFAVIGGSKISTKIEVLKNLLTKVDKLIIGGAMANTFLLAKNFSVGSSLVERDYLKLALEILDLAEDSGVKVYLPIDLVVKREEEIREVFLDEVKEEDQILDIGLETVKLFSSALEGAKTVVWNGPLGYFEEKPFDRGTCLIARKIATLSSITIAGGGDTLLAIKRAGVEHAFSFLSIAGGAFLEYLEGKELPGIAVLKK